MKILETYTSSADIVQTGPEVDRPQTYTNGLVRFRDDIVKLQPIAYAGPEMPILYRRPEVNEFMLNKPA